MSLEHLPALWERDRAFSDLVENVSRRSYQAALTGVDGSAGTFLLAGLSLKTARPMLIVTADMPRAEKIYADLQAFLPGRVNLLPPRELFINPEVITRSEDARQPRMQFMEWLYAGVGGVFIAPIAALITMAVPPAAWRSQIRTMQVGASSDRDQFIEYLVGVGYERRALVEQEGQFSVRGEIMDLFPPGHQKPLRINFFADQIESLRNFDLHSQRSQDQLSVAAILPARELFILPELFAPGREQIGRQLEKRLSALRKNGDFDLAARLKQQVTRHLDRLAEPEGLDLLSYYYPFFYQSSLSLVDYLSADHLIILDEPTRLAEKGKALREELTDFHSHAVLRGDYLASGRALLHKEHELFTNLVSPVISFSSFSGSGGLFDPNEQLQMESKALPYYHAQWDQFFTDYARWVKEDYQVILAASTLERGRGLQDLLSQNALSDQEVGNLAILTGSVNEGFVIPSLKLAVVNEQNLVPRRRKKRRLRQRDGLSLSDYRDLNVGDYVVHEQHGIGKYQGLNTLEVGGLKRDYLLLKYRGTDRLYIPTDQVGLIQKYSAGEAPPPKLHSLGGGEWQRLKSRVNCSVEELARELLALYAARQAVEGYSFGADHPWQKEFEDRFFYEETEDQLKAINEVKADLEKPSPMDRLVCGDVGYGKTEVAMRAAFKVVTEGKQVAVLVPTTVLAQQHYRTFRERFAGFPVNIEQLSRFVKPMEQKGIIEKTAAGQIDILIGTHRLLSKDLKFRDLGLLVLDEEQRFGVRQKEKMKQLRLEVDTLAMTATPIPRTLHLSLAGARDLSIIDTPPENRYPVQTYVLEYSDQLLEEAVQREINRQGQVYLLINRVDRIDVFAEKIQLLFPAASVAVAHGQLPEAKLEKVMADFQDGRYQILVCTTIIESGLDIPNVNTLLVIDADRFGLAQLYQIRGRVGRSNRLAYAYLTFRKEKVISEVAQKRLQAVREFTELGSGFKIALRDLEIRGAGNILGAEQHGFITAVGFDLYARLLDQAVAELKNEKKVEVINPRLELQVSAYLPASYIIAQDQKVDFYQRIYHASSAEELDDIGEELKDRYGDPPGAVLSLLAIAALRIKAAQLGIELIQETSRSIMLQFNKRIRSLDRLNFNEVTVFAYGQLKISAERPFKISINRKDQGGTQLNTLNLFLDQLIAAAEKKQAHQWDRPAG